jgi:uncharacterized protein (DUF1330 family)
MQNRVINIKRKYEKKLTNAIQKAGGISLKKDSCVTVAQPYKKGVTIDFITLAEPKGLYAVDNYDLELIAVEAIMQEVATGEVVLYNQEFGVMRFEFDFMGNKEACYKYLLNAKQSNALGVASLHIKINGSDNNE